MTKSYKKATHSKEGRAIAKVDVKKFSKIQQQEGDGEYESQQALISFSEGNIDGNKDGFKLTLPVRKSIF